MLLIEHLNNLLVEHGEPVEVPTPRLCKEIYREYNAKYFSNQLPADLEISVSSRMDKTWGMAGFVFELGKLTPKSIKISSRRAITDFALRCTLLHEMVHILDFVTNPQHFIQIRKNQYVKVTNYDSHGDWFMNNPISQKIRQDGFVIEKYIQDDMRTSSELSDKMKAKAEAIIKKGVYVVLVKYNNGKIVYAKINENIFRTYQEHPEWFEASCDELKGHGAIEFFLAKTSNYEIALSKTLKHMPPVDIDIEKECEVALHYK